MLPQYLDSYSLPVTLDRDAGDSCADYFNILALSNESDSLVDKYFHEAAKAPIRHPDASKWCGQPDRQSRDQLIPILCYAVIRGIKSAFIMKVFKSHLKRGLLFAWNTKKNGAIEVPSKTPDITFLEVWGLWLRVFKPIGYQLLLPICDLETLANSLLWRYYHPTSNHITRNHMLISITQNEVSPSFISKLSNKINNYKDLNNRWKINCDITKEYPTHELFKTKLGL